ncbi:AraC family transcriptional regulator [Aliiroseovarius sp. KMU-50]|uniref:AraC family transcriptional regulator n=1 Tax=Aliiroseovarius salicola TaxID=3009082 RepID=A0ABT4W5G7_9RHOB|nr:AraC family transcriptional regulator [Aliiroseovarius sp. KMU-50]MDA5095758.1 AraC family transcriptional regulator [Aliiroseovarius sp. KMU-50]
MQLSHEPVLNELDIQAEPFAVCTLEGSCKLYLGQRPEAVWHYVVSGTGKLKIQSMTDVELHSGRIVLVPAGSRHSLIHNGSADVSGGVNIPAKLDLERIAAKGEGNGKMIVLCGAVSLGMRNTNGLVDLLRTPLHLDIETSAIAERAVLGIIDEVTGHRTGGQAMVRLLLLQCVFEILRQRLEAGDPALIWLSGLADPNLWQALRVMLDNPGGAHSLESLAEAAGMSRSRFAEQFKAAYGRAPMSFLRELRMARAAQMLLDGRQPVKQIARKLGFQSRSAFTRAFTEFCGQSPRLFRTSDHSCY